MAQTKSERAEIANSAGKGRGLVFLSRILFGLSVIMLLAEIVFGDDGASPTGILIVLANGIVALLIIARYPRHKVGWLLLIVSLLYALPFRLLVESSLVDSSTIFGDILFWVGLWIWYPPVIVPIIFIPLYFPDGRLLTRRWRFVALAAALGMLAGIAAFAIHPGGTGDFEELNPFQWAGGAAVAEFLWQTVSIPLMTVALLGAYASLILRYRRSAAPGRAQMKWVLYTLLVGFILLGPWGTLQPLLPESLQSTLEEIQLGNIMVWILTIALPLSIGIAILRYRLFDIDVIIRKTLTYGLLTGVLLLVYFGSIVLLQQLFTGISGQRSPVAIVISTLAIYYLFRPLRQRIQAFIDRRFYRRNYDAAQTLADFAATARDEVDLNQLTAELLRVVQETMQPEQVGLWLAPMNGPNYGPNHGQPQDGDNRR